MADWEGVSIDLSLETGATDHTPALSFITGRIFTGRIFTGHIARAAAAGVVLGGKQ